MKVISYCRTVRGFSCNEGFTLIEVLIAMAITAVIGVIAYTAINTALSASESSTAQIAKLNELNNFYNRFARDVRQTVPRGVRDEYGEPESILWGGDGEGDLLTLTRSGWQNFTSASRSHLQRVSYVWREDGVWRQSWRVLDRTQDSEPVEYLLLSNVQNVQIRFLELRRATLPGGVSESEWKDEWDSESTAIGVDKLPIAIELSIEIEGLGLITRLIEVVAYGA